ncbi:D-erythronate dehydrogenase [Rothia nasimurium]|uniref:D-erythronate dehydrogenase n=1 Tax=Rothia nasimurium TaxID=85336 RepID=UPI001C8A0BAD|nr:D-erythronate dehydrogenase [Rothia nasimurium]
MDIVITGGAGFLGTQLIKTLLHLKDSAIEPIDFDGIVAVDLVAASVEDARVRSMVGDISDPGFIESVITSDTAVIYHLAAVLSGGSANNFDGAMSINVDATRLLLERARVVGVTPKFIFTSSLAVFGGALPDVVPASWGIHPDSTYGATKAIGELLVNEYTRKGYIDGLVCRLPTISVRPGVPNSAASSFASGIIREPLNGIDATCPVPHTTLMWLSSPQTVVSNLVHALSVPAQQLPSWRVLNIPGISVTVGGMLESLQRVAGEAVRSLVTDELNPAVADIVCTWPGAFDVSQELALGFIADSSFDDVIMQYQDGMKSNHW